MLKHDSDPRSAGAVAVHIALRRIGTQIRPGAEPLDVLFINAALIIKSLLRRGGVFFFPQNPGGGIERFRDPRVSVPGSADGTRAVRQGLPQRLPVVSKLLHGKKAVRGASDDLFFAPVPLKAAKNGNKPGHSAKSVRRAVSRIILLFKKLIHIDVKLVQCLLRRVGPQELKPFDHARCPVGLSQILGIIEVILPETGIFQQPFQLQNGLPDDRSRHWPSSLIIAHRKIRRGKCRKACHSAGKSVVTESEGTCLRIHTAPEKPAVRGRNVQ